MTGLYRVSNHQPQNIYRGEKYIGVTFDPADAALIVAVLNDQEGDVEAPKMMDRAGDIWYRVMCHGREVWTLDDQHHLELCRSAESDHVIFSYEQLVREWGPLRGVE